VGGGKSEIGPLTPRRLTTHWVYREVRYPSVLFGRQRLSYPHLKSSAAQLWAARRPDSSRMNFCLKMATHRSLSRASKAITRDACFPARLARVTVLSRPFRRIDAQLGASVFSAPL